jgi:hypothetical protein
VDVDALRGAGCRSLSIHIDCSEECERRLIEAGREGVEQRLDVDGLGSGMFCWEWVDGVGVDGMDKKGESQEAGR